MLYDKQSIEKYYYLIAMYNDGGEPLARKRRVNRITKTGPGGGVDAYSTTVLELGVPAGAGRLTEAYGTFCFKCAERPTIITSV